MGKVFQAVVLFAAALAGAAPAWAAEPPVNGASAAERIFAAAPARLLHLDKGRLVGDVSQPRIGAAS